MLEPGSHLKRKMLIMYSARLGHELMVVLVARPMQVEEVGGMLNGRLADSPGPGRAQRG